VATNLTIKSENQNTALNSLTERQHDPLWHLDKIVTQNSSECYLHIKIHFYVIHD